MFTPHIRKKQRDVGFFPQLIILVEALLVSKTTRRPLILLYGDENFMLYVPGEKVFDTEGQPIHPNIFNCSSGTIMKLYSRI